MFIVGDFNVQIITLDNFSVRTITYMMNIHRRGCDRILVGFTTT